MMKDMYHLILAGQIMLVICCVLRFMRGIVGNAGAGRWKGAD